MKRFPAIAMWLLALIPVMGASFSDHFTQSPTAWKTHNPGAVSWNESAGKLAVTWDSRQTNSFFYYPLGTTLTRGDSFSFQFTLRMDDLLLGIDPNKRYTFPLCIGFVNLAQAKRPEYFRGAGVRPANGPRSIVEFSYFADSGFGATIGPIIASTNNQIAFSHTFPVELTPGDTYTLKADFDPQTQTLNTQIERNGEPYGEPPNNTIRPLVYGPEFGDFRVDAFSITSYNDAGQSPPQFAGSVLAHGTIDDVTLTWPDPPVVRLAGRREGETWVVSFEAVDGWSYHLERTQDLASWAEVANGAVGPLKDEEPPADAAFYRVVAERP